MLARGLTPFPSYLGLTQASQGLALLCINYFTVYLGLETALRWFGEGLVILTPGWGGNPLVARATGEY